MANHRCVVFLAEKDAIINSSKVRAYLQTDLATTDADDPHPTKELQRCEVQSPLRVIWCADIDHGQIFDIRAWRTRLKSEVLGEAKQAKQV